MRKVDFSWLRLVAKVWVIAAVSVVAALAWKHTHPAEVQEVDSDEAVCPRIASAEEIERLLDELAAVTNDEAHGAVACRCFCKTLRGS